MSAKKLDSLKVHKTLDVNGRSYRYFDLPQAAKKLKIDLAKLPYSLKILLENLLRYEDGQSVALKDIKAIAGWLDKRTSNQEIAYRPARVLMQDFTGVPAVVDLAAMRDAVKSLKGNVSKINPLSPVDLVIDHSVMVDHSASKTAFEKNVALEMQRNYERYEFLRWGQEAFDNFRVVPPGTGICHQVNLEYLARVVWTKDEDGETTAYPDTLVGTDSHTTMVNGLGVLGWGVGGIEAEAAMLGQPISLLIPEVVGFKLTGELPPGTTATDLVLTVTQMLRKKGVVEKFVEFYGPGLHQLPLADRATIANMAPEYGATCGLFPIDNETIKYLKLSGRPDEDIALVEAYAKAQGMWHDKKTPDPVFSDTLELDLSTIEPSMAGPKRPQDRIGLKDAASQFLSTIKTNGGDKATYGRRIKVGKSGYDVGDGDIVIAAITSCTNTSNPSVMIAAGLVARKAVQLGITVKPWVKPSLAPGSQVVTEYLESAGLQKDLDKIGFNLVGYGCTTCIGNSGPLDDTISQTIKDNDILVGSVLSGNRNFEGRVHPLTKVNYLMSPPLVVAYALAGNMGIDIMKDPIAQNAKGQNIYLKDIWPTRKEVEAEVQKNLTPQMFRKRYKNVFAGDKLWQDINITKSTNYSWDKDSTYVKNPPYFVGMKATGSSLADVRGARILALFGDSITTDHISPAGNIAKKSPAADYLTKYGVPPEDFNSYGARRGNHEVMMRGTFANIRIKNEMVPGVEGGFTRHIPTNETLSIYDAAMKYKANNTPLVIFAGKEYGTGSSRDWAAKGTVLLGVKAVIVESFERIHRSNLVGMGVLPLAFKDGMTRKSLNLDGSEIIDLTGITDIKPGMDVECTITYKDGTILSVPLLCRINTADEVEYFKNGGILHNVIRNLIKKAA